MADYKKYEVVVNCQAKAVVYAESEKDAEIKVRAAKVDKQLTFGSAVSINEVKDESSDSKKIIKNIVGSLQSKMKDLKYCTGCEQYKPKKEFKKNTWGDSQCKECAG